MKRHFILKNEDGSLLILTLIMLVLLTGIGIATSTNTAVELQIAGNEKVHKMTFYAADGGTEAGIELLEQNIESRGFSTTSVGNTTIYDLNFYGNEESDTESDNIPTDTNRDIKVPDIGGTDVYLKIFGDTELSTGSALQLAAGYEGKGRGIASGGAYIVYNIRSFAKGTTDSEAMVYLQWRHLL